MPRLVSVSASWCSGFDTFGPVRGLQAIERHQQREQVPGPRAGRQHRDDVLVEGGEADRVALAVHQVAERRREARAVLELRHRVMRPVAHRAADVEHQVAVEVRLLLELLDVVAIAARVDLPVDGGDVVAGNVLAVLGELDAEALERAAVQAGQQPFDDGPRLQLERAEARHDRRVEKRPIVRGPGHRYIPLFGSGTVSISLSMIASELMRSDSA